MLRLIEMKKIIAFILGLILLFIPQNVSAVSSNFTTDYNVTYNVLENALTHVTFDIILTNQTSQYYASSYSIQVGFNNINNVLASDSKGKITPKITRNDDGNNIEIVFNDRVVGLGKKLNLTISFDTKDIARMSGKIWDINIPGIAKQAEYNSFNVNVIVPKFLENPSYIKPDTEQFSGTDLRFTKEQLGKSGISISYGQEEIYNFNLSYHQKIQIYFPSKRKLLSRRLPTIKMLKS